MIDCREPRLLGGAMNPLRVARTGVAAIDEYRFARRRDEKRRRPAFGVDEMDVETTGWFLGGQANEWSHCQHKKCHKAKPATHGPPRKKIIVNPVPMIGERFR